MNEGDLTVNDLPTVSEKEARRREQRAYCHGVSSMYVSHAVPYSREAAMECERIKGEARKLYPMPKRTVTRPRVLVCLYGISYRVVDGEVQFLTTEGRWMASSANGGLMIRERPEFLRMLADLIENPTETVEIPDDE